VKIKKANVRRLASLSALGAGALGMATGTAEASSIVYSGILDERVGFLTGFQSKATFAGPNGAGGMLVASAPRPSCTTGPCNRDAYVFLFAHQGAHGTNFRFRGFSGFLASAFPLSAQFGAPARPAQIGQVAVHQTDTITFPTSRRTVNATSFNATDRYLPFRFSGGLLKEELYGWAQLNVSFAGGLPYGPKPEVTLVEIGPTTLPVHRFPLATRGPRSLPPSHCPDWRRWPSARRDCARGGLHGNRLIRIRRREA